MRVNVHKEMFKVVMGFLIVLFAFSCTEIEEFDPQSVDADQIAKAYNFSGPLVEPINWAMRGRPDNPGNGGSPGNTGNNGGNVECSEVGDFEFSSGRNNLEDGEFDFEWPEGLEVTITDGTYVEWSFTAPDGYCLESLAIIVKGGPAANVFEYESGVTWDEGLASPVNASGKPASLSNLTFCWNLVEEPKAPESDGDQEECFGDEEGEVTSLTASVKNLPEGVKVVWYNAATGGDEVADPTLSEIGEVTYWAEAEAFAGCVSSERTPVTLKLKDCSDGNGNGGGNDWCGKEETGWAGSSEGAGASWWYYFDPSKGATQPIYAGQNLTGGTITYLGEGKFVLDLGDDLRLQDDDESVKAQGYVAESLPTFRPNFRNFEYKGNSLEFEIKESDLYAIHLDLEVKIECPTD